MERPLDDREDTVQAMEDADDVTEERPNVHHSRRAGLRPDERDPEEAAGEPGSAGGEENMSGTPGGGMASGGLAGTNAPSGAVEGEIDELSDGFGDGIRDVSGAEETTGAPPYAGHSGGAVGGSPAEKRAKGGRIPPGEGIVPQGDHAGDSTVGKDPSGHKGKGSRAAGRKPAGSTDTSDQ